MRRLLKPLAAAVALACLSGHARAQAVAGADSGPIPIETTLGSGTLSAGNALGLFTIPVARFPGGSGIITSFLWKSVNGDTTQKLGRLWSAKPVNTTCNNGSPFSSSDIDDAYLIGGGPFTFTPAAPASTTGDSATYANLTGLTWDFKSQDGIPPGNAANNNIAPSQNVYLCVITTASDTSDVSHAVRVTLSGPQN